jgi:broad specificity phosphatase PhoE
MARDTTHFTFIRHGETDWNRQQRFQGQIDVPLNEIGLAQAQRLGQRLAADPAELLHQRPDPRTRQTAEPLAGAWRLSPLADAWLSRAELRRAGGPGRAHHQRRTRTCGPLAGAPADFACPAARACASFTPA